MSERARAPDGRTAQAENAAPDAVASPGREARVRGTASDAKHEPTGKAIQVPSAVSGRDPLASPLESVRPALAELADANAARDAERSSRGARSLRYKLARARDTATNAAEAAVVAELEREAKPHLDAAFEPTAEALAMTGGNTSLYKREVAKWRGDEGGTGSRQLPGEVRGDLEQATGRSLGHVQLHDGPEGAAVAAQHGARAVAIGRDIHMGAGQLDPASPDGRELLAHEVAHVVQAEAHSNTPALAKKVDGTGGENAAERDADGFAASFRASGSSARWSPGVAVTGGTPLRKPEGAPAAKSSEPAKPVAPIAWTDVQATTIKNAPESVTADGYLSLWAAQLLEVVTKNAGPVPLQPHQRLQWTVPNNVPDQLAMWLQMERARFGGDDRAVLVRLLYPSDLFTIVDTYRDLRPPPPGQEGHGPVGSSAWQSAISDVIAAEVRPKWQESIVRAGQRYVAAADELHAGGVHDEQEIKRRLAANNSILPHSPLDHIVLLVMRDAQMVKYTPATKKAPREYAQNELQPLAITCMGASDPTLWRVLRVDTPGATAEQLAAVLFSKSGDAVAHSYGADMITVAAPYYILPAEWAATITSVAGQVGPAAYEPAEEKKKREGGKYDPPAMQRANAQEAPDARTLLAQSSISEEIALAQNEVETKRESGKAAGTHAEAAKFAGPAATQIGASFDRLHYLQEVMSPWDLSDALEPLRVFLVGAREKTTRSAVLNASWSSLIERHGQLLWQISEHVGSFVTEVGSSARAGDPTTPVGNVLRLYARAAGASHLVGVGPTMLAEAEKARQGVMLATVEFALRSSGAAVAEERGFEHQTRDVDPAALNIEGTQKDLKARAAKMRHALLQGSAVDAAAAETLILEAERNRLIASVASLKLQLHEFKVAADKGTLKFLPGLAENAEHLNMRLDAPFFEAELAKIPEFLKIPEEKHFEKRSEKDAKDPNLPDEATLRLRTLRQYVQDAHDKLGALKQEYRIEEFLQRANQVLADQQWRTMVVSAAALIGLGLVTGGAASFVGGVVRGTVLAELGTDAAALASTVRTARAAGTAAELITDAALTGAGQQALMGGDASFAENLVANALTRFALHPLGRLTSGLGEVDKRSLTAWERVGHGTKFVLAHGLQLSAEMITSTAIGYAVHRVASMAKGEKPSDEMVDSWLLQGVSFALGRYLNGRLQHQMDALSKLGQRAGRLPARMRTLAGRAAELERSGSPDQALEVLVEHRALVADEVELIGKLEREGKLRPNEAEALRKDASGDDSVIESHAFASVQARASKLVPVVEAAGRWAGDPADITAMIRRAADLGIESRIIEPGNAQKRWKVKVGDAVLEIDERPATGAKAPADERGAPRRADDPDANRRSPSEELASETDVDGRIALAGDDANLRAGAQRAQPDPGYVDVVVHADENHFYIVRNGVEIAVTHRTVAKMLEKAGLKPPTKIRLLACEGGKSPSAVAQHLANKTGLEVKAPTKKVWVDEAGTVGVGNRRGKHEGEWETFKPYDKDSGKPPPELESKRVLVAPEEGGRVDPRAPDRDRVLESKHDHRDRVEAWNHDQLQAQVGKPLILEPTLGAGVRIKVTKTAAGYEVTAVYYGPDARANDVQRHADIVAKVERYNGLVGKLRSWKDSLFGPRAKHDYARGSRGDRLHTELEKLEAHIRDTDILRSNDAVDAARAKEEIEFLTDAVNEIREQLDDKHHDLHTQDAEFDIARVTEPVGYITQKAEAAGFKRPGEDGVTIEGVTGLNKEDYYYRRNGDTFELARMPGRDVPQLEVVTDSAGEFRGIRVAKDRAAETKLLDLPYDRARDILFAAEASMDPYAQMLEHLKIATRADVEATAKRLYEKQTMKDTSTIDSWRKAIKKQYRGEVEKRLYDPSLSDAESYRQLRDAVDLLANKDRANVVEGWYRARRLGGADVQAQVEYTVTRTSGKDAGKSEKREADFVVAQEKIKGKEIVEIKDIEDRLDKEQFAAYVDALRDGKTRAKLGAERMRYVFTKASGAKESLDFLAKAYDRYELTDRLVIEVYMPNGSHETASNAPEALRILKTLRDQ